MLVLNKAKELSKAYREIREEAIIEFLQNGIPDIQKDGIEIETKLNLDEIAEWVNLGDKNCAYIVLLHKVKDILKNTFGCVVVPKRPCQPKPDTDWFFWVIRNQLTKFLIQWDADYLYAQAEHSMMCNGKFVDSADDVIYMFNTIFSAAEHGETSCILYKDHLYHTTLNHYKFLTDGCKLTVVETDTDFTVSGWL